MNRKAAGAEQRGQRQALDAAGRGELHGGEERGAGGAHVAVLREQAGLRRGHVGPAGQQLGRQAAADRGARAGRPACPP